MERFYGRVKSPVVENFAAHLQFAVFALIAGSPISIQVNRSSENLKADPNLKYLNIQIIPKYLNLIL